MLHLIRSGIELWQSGVVVLGQSDPEHKNAASVWTPLTKGRFMDLDFTLWGTGIWNATMSSRQGTTEKYHWCAIVGMGCSLSHRVGVAST